MSLYSHYKPLRNRCRELQLDDSLFVIWAYAQWLQVTGFHIPEDIEVDPILARANQPRTYVSEWELEALTRELVLHSDPINLKAKTLRSSKTIATVVNLLKAFEKKVSADFVSPDNILVELHRIANRQFLWQRSAPNATHITRYYKIFSHPGVETIVRREIGLTIKEILYIGLALTGAFLKNPAIKAAYRIELGSITPNEVTAFLKFTCTPLETIRDIIKHEHIIDENFAYSFNALRTYPLISMKYRGDEAYVCPLPTLLFWRITDGIYYEICGEKDFANPFGDSFETYVGDVLTAGTDADRFQKLPEMQYGSKKNRKHTVDWVLLEGSSAALFIECKTKRLSWRSKIALTDMEAVDHDLDFLASAILQLYKTILDYRDGHYPHVSFESSRKIYPLVATLEPWNLVGPDTSDRLMAFVSTKLSEAGIDQGVIEEMPYSICSVDELEQVVQCINQTSVQEFTEPKLYDAELRQWMFDPYCNKFVKENDLKIRPLFEDVYEDIFADIKTSGKP